MMNKYTFHEVMSDDNKLIHKEFKSFLDKSFLINNNFDFHLLMQLTDKLLRWIILSIFEFKIIFDFLLSINSPEAKRFLDIFCSINQKHYLSKYKIDLLTNLNFHVDKWEIFSINNEIYIWLDESIWLVINFITDKWEYIVITRSWSEFIVDKFWNKKFWWDRIKSIHYLSWWFYICTIDWKSTVIDSFWNKVFDNTANSMIPVWILTWFKCFYQISWEIGQKNTWWFSSFSITSQTWSSLFWWKFKEVYWLTWDFDSNEYVFAIKDNSKGFYDVNGVLFFHKENFTPINIGLIKNSLLIQPLLYWINSDYSPCLINKDWASFFNWEPWLELWEWFFKDTNWRIYIWYINSYWDYSYFDIYWKKQPTYWDYSLIPFEY